MTNDQIVATLREKADRLDRFFGTMSDDGKAPRADRTLMLEAAATIERLTEAVKEAHSVALENRCERQTPWDFCCMHTSQRLKVYAGAVLRGATAKDALYNARLDAADPRLPEGDTNAR